MAGRRTKPRAPDDGRDPFPDLVPDEDCKRLVLALAETRGDRGFTEAEVARLIDWAQHTRAQMGFLELTLAGHVAVDVRDGDIGWKARPPAEAAALARVMEAALAGGPRPVQG